MIYGILKEGLEFPKAAKGSQWTKSVVAQLRSLECSVVTNYKINSMLNHLEHLGKQMKLAEIALKSHVTGNQDPSSASSI